MIARILAQMNGRELDKEWKQNIQEDVFMAYAGKSSEPMYSRLRILINLLPHQGPLTQ